jgi:hypothetical protein
MSEPTIESSLKEKNLLNDKVFIKIDTLGHWGGQCNIYQECIDQNKDLDWLLLCDADEFLWLKEGTIKDFLSKYSEDTCTILINWLVYGTSNLQTYDINKSVFEQFTLREDYNHVWNRFVKSFVRPKLIENVGNVHITYNSNYKVCNIYNNNICDYPDKNSNICEYPDNNLNDNSQMLLVHYMTLDFESMLNKYKKSHGTTGYCADWDPKYSLEWYKSSNHYGFKDNIKDLRMNKYI